jgi:hypothetical protein
VTRLSDLKKPAAADAKPSRLRGIMERDLRGEMVTLPYVGECWIELVAHDRGNAVEGDTLREMSEHGIPAGGMFGLSFESERAKQTLAVAAREADKVTPIGTLEDWGALDDDIIAACWFVYGDVRERLDPLGSEHVTADEVREIDAAIEKKNRMALLRFGVAKLSLYLLSTAARRASSPTPPSLPGESSPES